MKLNALVVGATGLVGNYLTHILSRHEEFESVYAVVRKKGSVRENDRIKEWVVDFEQLNFEGIKADIVFCSLGTTMKIAGSKEKFYRVDHDYLISTAEQAKALGAKIFVMVSSIGANASSPGFYLKVKGQTEKDLLALEMKHTIILRPSLLLGPRKEHRFGEKFGENVLKLLKPIMIGGLKKQVPVHASQVAACMIDHALNAAKKVEFVDSNSIRTYPQIEESSRV